MTRDDPNKRIEAATAHKLAHGYILHQDESDAGWRWKRALENLEPFVEGKVAGRFGPLSPVGDVHQGRGTLDVEGLRPYEVQALVNKKSNTTYDSS